MRKIFILVALFLYLLIPTSALAVSTNDSNMDDWKDRYVQKNEDNIQQKLQSIETLREKIKTRIATREAKLKLLNKERIRNHYRIMNKRFQATIQRLQNISVRIQKRLQIIEESGTNVDALRFKVGQASTLLENSSNNLSAAEASLEDILSSEDPLGAYIYLKDHFVLIKNDLKKAHALLVEVIAQVQGLHSVK